MTLIELTNLSINIDPSASLLMIRGSTMASCLALLRAISTAPSLPSDRSKGLFIQKTFKGSRLKLHCSSQSYYDQEASLLQDLGMVSVSVWPDANKDLQSIKHCNGIENIHYMLSKKRQPLESLELIDSLQRLGIDYHFSKEIKEILETHYYKNFEQENGIHLHFNDSLHEISLLFRLLRNNGFDVPSDIFFRFTNKKGKFKKAIEGDVQGLLSLHEASLLNMGEDILDEAKEFSYMQLKSSIGGLEHHAKISIEHSLAYPLHCSLQRFDARHYISHHQGPFRKNKVLKEVAMMDFNIVQALHKKELMEFLRWWTGTEIFQELKFTRDQPLKWFMWTVGTLPNPRFSKARIELVKMIAFIYIIDDIFDVYATPDELVLFTEAIKRWDASPMDQLPRYMKICYSALYDITNEIACMVEKEHGWNPINSLRKSWTTLCEAFLVETNWFARGHTPKPSEYLENGIISTGVHVVLVHLFFLVGEGVTKENVDSLDNPPGFALYAATILRLWDDLGSAKDENQEGFDGSYLECYLKENCNSSYNSAREHVLRMISNSWKNLNKEFFSPSSFPCSLRTAALNMARMVQVMYSYNNQSLPLLEEYVKLMILESV